MHCKVIKQRKALHQFSVLFVHGVLFRRAPASEAATFVVWSSALRRNLFPCYPPKGGTPNDPNKLSRYYSRLRAFRSASFTNSSGIHLPMPFAVAAATPFERSCHLSRVPSGPR